MPKDSTAYGPSSNPSSKSYSGGGGGGGVSSGKTTGNNNSSSVGSGSPLASLARLATAPPKTGLTTGTTIYGNTAFGPSGGNATGYATRTGNVSGMAPSMTTFSNFRTPTGGAMFSGQAGNTPVTARNAQQAAGMLAAMQRAQAGAGRSGMLSGDPVMSRPLPAIAPTAIPAPFQLTKAMLPALFGNRLPDPSVLRSLGMWPGQSAIPENPAVYTPGPRRSFGGWPGQSAIPPNPAVWSPNTITQTPKTSLPDGVGYKTGLPSNIGSIGTTYGRFGN